MDRPLAGRVLPCPGQRRPAAPSGTLGLPGAPVRVRLAAERDMTADGFWLIAPNRGEPGRFRAEVIGIHDQDGQAPVTPLRGWPIPWLDDGSITAKDIPTAGSPRLDIAHFSLSNLREDLEGTKWLNGDHWTFPGLPSHLRLVGLQEVTPGGTVEHAQAVISSSVADGAPTTQPHDERGAGASASLSMPMSPGMLRLFRPLPSPVPDAASWTGSGCSWVTVSQLNNRIMNRWGEPEEHEP